MSRTRKGSKGPGYEYWSRRPGSGNNPGRWSKTYTHRRERRAGDRLASRLTRDPEGDAA